jgi:uncharacterized protein
MQSSVTEKTVSARKRVVLLSIGGVALVVATVFSLLNFLYQAKSTDAVALRSGSRQYTLQVASTNASQALGLGKRASLHEDQGMLFVFRQPAVQCFWMQDMHFPIDMIWASSSKHIEYIEPNVSPDTYPHTFCPDVQASYVIELNAGQAKQTGMRTGELLSF